MEHPSPEDLGGALLQVGRLIRPNDLASRDGDKEIFQDPRQERRLGAGARYSWLSFNGRKQRIVQSCMTLEDFLP